MDPVFTRYENVLRSSVLLLVVLRHSPTILETVNKATVLRETRVHTYKELNDLKVPTGIIKTLLVCDIFQKKPHIVIQLLQMNELGKRNAAVFIRYSEFAWKGL